MESKAEPYHAAYCGVCGKKMPDEGHICPACGADMSEPPPEDGHSHPEKKPGFLRRLIGKITGR